jgi:hypothetical protein
MRTSLLTTVAAGALAATLGLTGCAAEAPDASPTDATTAPTSGATTSGGATAAPTAQVVNVTIKDGKVTPNGETVEVKVGVPIEIKVTADSTGEIHVHSDPEHKLDYKVGVSTLDFTIDRPGRIEVEVEQTSTLVVNLDAR